LSKSLHCDESQLLLHLPLPIRNPSLWFGL
jgi:hypothetical protein